jgi:small subunit ribosomal protein S29
MDGLWYMFLVVCSTFLPSPCESESNLTITSLAVNLVNSTTPYTYDLRTQTFHQPSASHQLLHRLRTVNASIFKRLKIEKPIVVEGFKTVNAGTNLYELCDVSREEVARAPVVLDEVMKCLEGQTT